MISQPGSSWVASIKMQCCCLLILGTLQTICFYTLFNPHLHTLRKPSSVATTKNLEKGSTLIAVMLERFRFDKSVEKSLWQLMLCKFCPCKKRVESAWKQSNRKYNPLHLLTLMCLCERESPESEAERDLIDRFYSLLPREGFCYI